MTRGKRLACPRIVVSQANEPKHATQDDAWAAVRPVLARILAQAILHEKAEQETLPAHKRPPCR